MDRSARRAPADLLEARSAAYHEAFAGHPDPARRVGWRGRGDQRLRFEACARAAPGAAAILDLGAGLGDLAAFLRRRGFRGDYLGVDVLSSMVLEARKRHPGERFAHTPEGAAARILDRAPPWDLAVACGALSLRVPAPRRHAAKTLSRLWQVATTLAVVAPSTRAVPLDPALIALPAATWRELLAALAPAPPRVTIDEALLPGELVVIATRAAGLQDRGDDADPVDALRARGELHALEAAELHLARDAPARALAALDDSAADAAGAEGQRALLRGRALAGLARGEEARAELRVALAAGGLTAYAARLELGRL
jgi:SAM-dependent methyltransferase